ncbi:hypothetical protein BJX99DRAFT_146256 [Aspergillus californicus]
MTSEQRFSDWTFEDVYVRPPVCGRLYKLRSVAYDATCSTSRHPRLPGRMYPLVSQVWSPLGLFSSTPILCLKKFSHKMPALDSLAIATQKEILQRGYLVERDGGNWANRNRGPVLVFVIVFIVVVGIVLLFLYRRIMAKRAARAQYE